MHLPGMVARKAIKAGLADDRLELTRSEELNPWSRTSALAAGEIRLKSTSGLDGAW